MFIRLVLATQLFAFFHAISASSLVCGAESDDVDSASFFVEPLEQEDAATLELSDLSLIQVSAIARMRSAKLGEDDVKTRPEAEVMAQVEAAPEAEPHFFKAMPAADTKKKRSHSKAPPVPLDKIIERGPRSGKVSFSGGAAVVRDEGSASAADGSDTAAASETASAAAISGLASRVEALERENAHLKQAVDASDETSAEMSRLERRIDSVERENIDLKRAAHSAMPANKTTKAHTKAIKHTHVDAVHDDHEGNHDNDDDDRDFAELNATIQKAHDESARLAATMKEIQKTRQVKPTTAHKAKQNRTQKEASGKADTPPTVFSALKIQSATDLASPSVLLGGLNFTGDPSATDDEKPLLNVSLVEGSGFSIAFTASWKKFHPYSRLLSLSDGSKDILRVSNFENTDTLVFSVRRCQHDGHECNHDASVTVNKTLVANVTERFLCTVSPRGKMEVFKNGTLVGRLKPDGTYATDQKGGQAVPSAETGLYMARRTWQQRKQGVLPFEGYIADVCFWSREVAFDEAIGCIPDAK